jgi:hypothetical protein
MGFVVVAILGSVLYAYVPDFRSRVDSSVGLWVREDFSLENINSSSFVLYNNYHIALENFKSNPITGTGLGSHPIAFDKYSLTREAGILDIHFNKADANSMILRIMSETGLIGLLFIFFFIFKMYVRKNEFMPGNHLWVISNSLLIIIILYLLRQGNYFINGFPMFMWLYYYTRVKYNQDLNTVQADEDGKTQDTLSVHRAG